MFRNTALAFFAALLLSASTSTFAQSADSALYKMIKPIPLTFENQQFSGEGWNTLQTEITKSQFVLVGEMHGMSEIATFTKEVAKELKPEVFVAETDPYTLDELQLLLNGTKPKAGYHQQNPWGLAFYSMQPEYDLMAYLHSQQVKFWGIDQVHLFSTGRFFEMLAQQAKRKENRQLALRKAQQYRQNDLPLFEDGNYGKLSSITMEAATIDSLLITFRKDSPKSRKMLEDLKTSHTLYHGVPHSQRINFMKKNLLDAASPYLAAGKPLPKTLYKLGAMHTFRNESLATIFDAGNLAANLADAQNHRSLHLLVIGKGGTYNSMLSSVNEKAIKAASAEKSGLPFLSPFLEQVQGEQPILFDLRPIRKQLDSGKLSIQSIDLRRVILGNEFLVVFPTTTGSKFID